MSSSFFATMLKENKEEPLASVHSSLKSCEYTNMSGSYECEDVDILNFENICLSFPTDKGEFKLFDNFNFSIKFYALYKKRPKN